VITENYRDLSDKHLDSAWPHKLTVRLGARIAVIIAILQAVALIVAAYVDQSLWLPGNAVGLLEHPGMLAIVLGDLILFILSIQAGRMTMKVGRRLPATQERVVRRYWRCVILRRLFGQKGIFFQIFLMLSLLGSLALVNQTVRLTNAQAYYGHDTFDSILHRWSFVVNRVNLFTSWCIVVPLFGSYLFAHTLAIRQIFRRCDKHRLVAFKIGHPDRHGGFAFFGWLDTLYVAGLVATLGEVALLIITHRRVTLGNLAGILAITIGAILISLLSIYEILRVVKRRETTMKLTSFMRGRRQCRALTLDYLTLVHGVSFSPYTLSAFRMAMTLRLIALVPATLRIVEYFSAKT
jgi:hypothetical protein